MAAGNWSTNGVHGVSESANIPQSTANKRSGRPDSNRRRPAWESVLPLCLEQLRVSGALYRLTASLAESAFSSFNPSNRGFFEVHFRVIHTSFSCGIPWLFHPDLRLSSDGPKPMGVSSCLHRPPAIAAGP